MNTLGDAFQLWSHQFQGSKLKAVIQLVGQLADTQKLALDSQPDLRKVRLALGRYIKRLDLKVRRQFRMSKDSTQCARAEIPVKIELRELTADLERFVDAFDDTKRCRSLCQIDHFLLKRYRTEIEEYAEIAEGLPRSSQNQGFIRLAEQLNKVLKKGPGACSCKHCEKIGDAVIALAADRTVQIEHTDLSFNRLCPPIKQPHRQHPSEIAVLKHGDAG